MAFNVKSRQKGTKRPKMTIIQSLQHSRTVAAVDSFSVVACDAGRWSKSEYIQESKVSGVRSNKENGV